MPKKIATDSFMAATPANNGSRNRRHARESPTVMYYVQPASMYDWAPRTTGACSSTRLAHRSSSRTLTNPVAGPGASEP